MNERGAVLLITIALFTVLCLCGCGGKAMSNEEIIREEKMCTDAGMPAVVVTQTFQGEISELQCVPKGNQ